MNTRCAGTDPVSYTHLPAVVPAADGVTSLAQQVGGGDAVRAETVHAHEHEMCIRDSTSPVLQVNIDRY